MSMSEHAALAHALHEENTESLGVWVQVVAENQVDADAAIFSAQWRAKRPRAFRSGRAAAPLEWMTMIQNKNKTLFASLFSC